MQSFNRAAALFKHKKVLVFGLGLLGGGIGDVKFLHACQARIRVTDKKSVHELSSSIDQIAGLAESCTFGEHRQEDIEWADIILRNPSIPYQHPLLEYARSLGKPIEMRTAIFAQAAGCPIIGITGTRGKTTTTMMIYSLCSQLMPSKKILLGGNIAHQSDLQLLETITDPDNTIAVLELSSWQLQGFKEKCISPQISVITNLYPDHLNTYPTLAAYYADKRVILEYQKAGDTAILLQGQPEFQQWAAHLPSSVRWFTGNTLPATLTLQIPGTHNRDNAAAALEVANALHLDHNQAVSVLTKFTGVPYRQQIIATKQGVTYINDTTATTPVAASIALKTYPESIFICGGSDKNLPVDDFIQNLNTYAGRIILLAGNGTDRIKSALEPKKIVSEVTSMDAAVTTAASIAQRGDTVVLSPGFTSFGLFNNEFHRGDEFNRCVNQLP